jgi:hypothetical protein
MKLAGARQVNGRCACRAHVSRLTPAQPRSRDDSCSAAWALITSIFEIVAGIMLRRVITGAWLAISNGILLVIFGVLLIVFPSAGALSLLWLIGTCAITLGMLLIVLAFRGPRGESSVASVRQRYCLRPNAGIAKQGDWCGADRSTERGYYER